MFKAILAPVDLAAGASSQKSVAVAADMAARYDADLHVMTVIPDYGMSIVGSFFDEHFAERAVAEAGDLLRDFCAEHIPESLRRHEHVARGSIYDELLRAADRLGVDCIVMGAHRPALKDYLLGPNAARVVRHAPCSVVVVRS